MRLLIKRLLSYVPTLLPVGLTSFYTWADSILELSGQYADKESMQFAIASMVIHLPAGKAYCSKNHFVAGLRKSAANQVASQVFQEIKTKMEEKQKAEATAAQQAKAADGQQETKET